MKIRVCARLCVVCVCADIFLGRQSLTFIIFSMRSILDGRSAYKKDGSAAEMLKKKKKRETTGPVKLPPFTVRETEAQGKQKQGKGSHPRSQVN